MIGNTERHDTSSAMISEKIRANPLLRDLEWRNWREPHQSAAPQSTGYPHSSLTAVNNTSFELHEGDLFPSRKGQVAWSVLLGNQNYSRKD